MGFTSETMGGPCNCHHCCTHAITIPVESSEKTCFERSAAPELFSVSSWVLCKTSMVLREPKLSLKLNLKISIYHNAEKQPRIFGLVFGWVKWGKKTNGEQGQNHNSELWICEKRSEGQKVTKPRLFLRVQAVYFFRVRKCPLKNSNLDHLTEEFFKLNITKHKTVFLKILLDFSRFFKILQDFGRFCKIKIKIILTYLLQNRFWCHGVVFFCWCSGNFSLGAVMYFNSSFQLQHISPIELMRKSFFFFLLL